jgi:hypothetical protein
MTSRNLANLKITVTSGNVAELKMISSGDRAVIDACWKRKASATDMRELEAMLAEVMKPKEMQSVIEEDDRRRSDLFDFHLKPPRSH